MSSQASEPPRYSLVSEPLVRYIRERFAKEDLVLEGIRRDAADKGLPPIHLPRETAKALQLLLVLSGAKRVLEIGTLAGYSAVWIARALPEDGRLVTLEVNPVHARIARASVARARVEDRVEILEGKAEDLLPAFQSASFDAVFLDADKEGLQLYLKEASRLLSSGGMLLADNVLWRGEVALERRQGPARYIHAFNEAVSTAAEYDAAILPVGDGLLIGVRR